MADRPDHGQSSRESLVAGLDHGCEGQAIGIATGRRVEALGAHWSV